MFLIQNLLFQPSSQNIVELLTMLPTLKNNWLENDNGLGQKGFLRVCGMCLSHVWYFLFAYCVLNGNWVLHGCDDYIICTTN